MNFFKLVCWPLQKIIEYCIIRPLGLFIRIAYGVQYSEYKFNKSVLKIIEKHEHERVNKLNLFGHETSYNVIISYCLFNIMIFILCYLIMIKIIYIPNDTLIHYIIKFLKSLFKYDTLAFMFSMLTLIFYDKVIYNIIRVIHNSFVVLVQL